MNETGSRHPSLDDRFDPAVRICDHDARWAVLAAQEIRRVRAEMGSLALRVEHVGSTAVPGLAAKPIVDLQLSLAALEPARAYVEKLERLGYLYVTDPESLDYRLFAKPARRPRSHHLHVCRAGSQDELRHLAVRDYLRAHRSEATAYEAHKRDAAARFPEDRLAYIAAKSEYVDQLEIRALR